MLARELGMTHKRLMREMGCLEFAYWIALYRREAREKDSASKRSERMAKIKAAMGR